MYTDRHLFVTLFVQFYSSHLDRSCFIYPSHLTADAVGIVRRGGHPENESLRGITPLLSCMINDSPLELIEALIKLKVNLNYVNRHGLTALSMACRLNSSKLVHVLMRNGASAITRVSSSCYSISSDDVTWVGCSSTYSPHLL